MHNNLVMMLQRYVLLICSSFLLFACGKGFKVNSEPVDIVYHEREPVFKDSQPELEDSGEFYRVKSKTKNTTNKPQKITLKNKEFDVVREKLQFSKLSYDYKDQKMTFKGQLRLGKEIKNFELKGVYNDGLLDLKTDDRKSEVYGRLKARMTCYALNPKEDETDCKNFFIDVYYLDQGTIYTEQLIPRKEADREPLVDTGETKKPRSGSSSKGQSGTSNAGTSNDQILEGDVIMPTEPKYFQGQNGKDIVDLFEEELDGQQDTQGKPVSKPDSKPESNDKPEQKPELKPDPKQSPKPAPAPSVKPGNKPNEKIARPTNQAVGGVGGAYGMGSLRNASNLLQVYNRLGRTSGFQILNPERNKYFGTWEMIKLIEKMGAWVRDNVPGQVLAIGNISTQFGGVQDGHVSHQSGMDVDIAYFTPMTRMENVVKASRQVSADLRLDDQLNLFQQFIGSEVVEMIIVDPTIKKALCQRAVYLGWIATAADKNLAARTLRRIYATTGHDDHFHLRIKCSAFDRACSPHEMPDQTLGCDTPAEKAQL